MGKIVEGLWDCKYCNSKGIGGSKRECPNCGRTRDADTRFYMPGQIKYVEEDKAKSISKNPDWVCGFCDCLNPDTVDTCMSCGSKRTNENFDFFQNQNNRRNNSSVHRRAVDDWNEPTYTKKTTDTSEKAEEFEKNSLLSSNFFKSLKKPILITFSVIAVIAIIFGVIWLLMPKKETITIDQVSWERKIEIERFQTVDESSWSLPEDARLHYTKREIYTYEQVFDHYETKTRQVAKQRFSHYETRVVGYRDLGNGYFEEITEQVPVYETYYDTEYYQEPVYRNEPVYRTKYYYEIDKWLYDRTLKTSGKDKSPFWPNTDELKDNERESIRKENYFISYTSKKGKTKQVEMTFNEWSDLMIGDTITINVSVLGKGKLE